MTSDPPPVVPSGATTYAAEPLGAGGWVTGMTISPDGLTRLGRTDTMGAWRWDTSTDRWAAITTGTSLPSGFNSLDSGRGVNAIAASNTVAFMGYQSSIFTSIDKGVSWSVSLLNGPVTAPNLGSQRWWNTRMAFDPNNSNTLLYGTANAGLFYTTDGGGTWTQVPAGTVPIGSDGAATPGTNTFGIPCTAIDAAGNWYAAPFGNGVYTSTDYGTTWTKISSDAQFLGVSAMAVGPNGDLMITGHTSTSNLTTTTSVIYRYRAGSWANVTPSGTLRVWRPLAYDPLTAGRVVTQGVGGYERISLDYGTTWAAPWHTYASPGTDVPWLAAANGFGANNFYVTSGGLQFDPLVPNRLWESQGIGVWYADLPSDPTASVPWVSQSRGIEQLVINDVLAPPGGGALGNALTVGWDRPIFLTGETP